MGLSWVLTWLTFCLGLCGQFTIICPGPPQYRHRLFAQRRYFSTCDNGPRRRVISNSIGVGNSIKHGFDTCGGLETQKHMFLLVESVTFVGVQNTAQISDCHIARPDLLLQ